MPARQFLALGNCILTLWVAEMETRFLQFSPIIAITVPLVNAQYVAGLIAREYFPICDLICYLQRVSIWIFLFITDAAEAGKVSTLTDISLGFIHFDSTVTRMLSVSAAATAARSISSLQFFFPQEMELLSVSNPF